MKLLKNKKYLQQIFSRNLFVPQNTIGFKLSASKSSVPFTCEFPTVTVTTVTVRVPENHIFEKFIYTCIKERGGGLTFSIFFWMRFNQAPLCRYGFKVIFDDIIVLLLGNIL